MDVHRDPYAFQRAFLRRCPSAQPLMRLFDTLPDVAFYAKDTASRFVKVNGAFLVGHAAMDESEVLGRDDRHLSPPVMAAAYMAEDRRVMDGGRPIVGQVWHVFHAGKLPRWYVSSKTPLRDERGKVMGLAGAMYPIERPEELAEYTRELLPVVRHIEQCYPEPVSCAEMAKLAGLSSTHFNRRFRQIFRMSPLKYLLTVRVLAAQRLLSGTNQSLARIAADIGFTDQSHFTKRFKLATGLTPAGYRRRFRGG